MKLYLHYILTGLILSDFIGSSHIFHSDMICFGSRLDTLRTLPSTYILNNLLNYSNMHENNIKNSTCSHIKHIDLDVIIGVFGI